jgi:hypothetical protein
MTTTVAPLDNAHAVTFNRFANGDDNALAERFDKAIRELITATGAKKIYCIKILRSFAVCFGAEMGLLEAKVTIDGMISRMTVEILRDMMSVRVDSYLYRECVAKLEMLAPPIWRAFRGAVQERL